jgi:hypothetical protein
MSIERAAPADVALTSRADFLTGVSFRVLVFLSSFLMFQVELLIARRLLPRFGSSAAVWTTSLVFFQFALLLGYLYAARFALAATQGHYRFLHLGFAALAGLVLPFRLVVVEAPPALSVLVALALAVGLPFIALSTTSIVAQAWLTRTNHPSRSDPYFLYGTSNAGAVLSLLCYPLLVEPALDLALQERLWYALYALYVLVHAACLRSVRGPDPAAAVVAAGPAAAPTRPRYALWLLLSAAANALLMAVTNVVTADAPLPLLWVVPLTIYLSTLVICFLPRMPSAAVFDALGLFGLALAAVALVFVFRESHLQAAYIVLHAASLWVGCLVLHRNLSLSKPADSRLLGDYYLSLSVGGVVGALLIGILMPVVARNVSTAYVDYAVAAALMAAALLTRDAGALVTLARRYPKRTGAAFVLAVAFVAMLVSAGVAFERSKVHGSRTFYGLYSVVDKGALRWFFHGNTVHGIAHLDPKKRSEPLAYFHESSPIGRALASDLPRRRVGLVGLGVGTLTSYGRPSDRWDIYELDPEVEIIARRHFSFLEDARAGVKVHLGDARLTLERAPDRAFDILILDAFSSDYVPTHLLTREAFALYLQKLEPGGVLFCHISNRIFDLRPVLTRIAAEHALLPAWLGAVSPESSGEGRRDSMWFVFARRPDERALISSLGWQPADARGSGDRRVWSDDYVNLFDALR